MAEAVPTMESREQRYRIMLKPDMWRWLRAISDAAKLSVNMTVEAIIAERIDSGQDLTLDVDAAAYADERD